MEIGHRAELRPAWLYWMFLCMDGSCLSHEWRMFVNDRLYSVFWSPSTLELSLAPDVDFTSPMPESSEPQILISQQSRWWSEILNSPTSSLTPHHAQVPIISPTSTNHQQPILSSTSTSDPWLNPHRLPLAHSNLSPARAPYLSIYFVWQVQVDNGKTIL